ncbi:MAG: HAD-IA family hydrolase [Blastomonas fulva]|jgi:putative hydrolase of the HAD superfamily|uniref:HAD-IA family hydrolase n=1 Tax=Blastomonas TaxID=150203 RepID=UPI0024E26350|nr:MULTISPECIES: HAD-IA family hydrolase [Blastomonas]MDK2758339.1 HAD-IA family hydrolase [Blastomonas fulva]
MTFSAVIFDFGGVITSSPFEAFNRLEAERGLPRDCIRRINATNPDDNAWARFERAEIDASAFDDAFAAEAAALGLEISGADVISCLAGDIRQRMVAALDALKAGGYTLGCITNNVRAGKGSAMVFDDSRAAQIAAIMARFDHVIESSKAGVRKPDPRIYAMMCDALEVAPKACIYLDDLGVNCKPAAAMGMAAIKVTGETQALADLRALLGLPGDWPRA